MIAFCGAYTVYYSFVFFSNSEFMYFNSKWLGMFMIVLLQSAQNKKPYRPLEDERVNHFRGTTSVRRSLLAWRTPDPDHHQGLAVTGEPVPVYWRTISRFTFCGNRSGWLSALNRLWRLSTIGPVFSVRIRPAYSSRSMAYSIFLMLLPIIRRVAGVSMPIKPLAGRFQTRKKLVTNKKFCIDIIYCIWRP